MITQFNSLAGPISRFDWLLSVEHKTITVVVIFLFYANKWKKYSETSKIQVWHIHRIFWGQFIDRSIVYFSIKRHTDITNIDLQYPLLSIVAIVHSTLDKYCCSVPLVQMTHVKLA